MVVVGSADFAFDWKLHRHFSQILSQNFNILTSNWSHFEAGSQPSRQYHKYVENHSLGRASPRTFTFVVVPQLDVGDVR